MTSIDKMTDEEKMDVFEKFMKSKVDKFRQWKEKEQERQKFYRLARKAVLSLMKQEGSDSKERYIELMKVYYKPNFAGQGGMPAFEKEFQSVCARLGYDCNELQNKEAYHIAKEFYVHWRYRQY